MADGIDWLLIDARFDDGGPEIYQVFWDGAADVAHHQAVVAWLFPELAGRPVRLLPGEQSNTSVVVADEVIIKVFRRMTAGGNLDAEVVRRLWEVGYREVPEPLGECRRGGLDLAVARRFVAGAHDGWRLALDSTDFTGHAATLGGVTARMHRSLARAFGSARGDGAEWARPMLASLAVTVDAPGATALEARFTQLGQMADVGAEIRKHGDFHLGQVLYDHGRWLVLDFEGEPARPVAERLRPASPLTDVAGMVRSFGYAAAASGFGGEWERDCVHAFVTAYLVEAAPDRLLPPNPAPVLAALIADKALYELRYERANRPDWAWIPLQALGGLTDT